MLNTADMVMITGLVLDIVGVIMLFVFALTPDPQSLAFFAIEDNSRDKWQKRDKLNRRMLRVGLIMMIAGFSLQGLSLFV